MKNLLNLSVALMITLFMGLQNLNAVSFKNETPRLQISSERSLIKPLKTKTKKIEINFNSFKSIIPLWKVTSNQRTIYFTGAMDIPLDARPVPKPTQRAFVQSGILILEGKIGEKAKARVKMLLKKYGTLPKGKTIADELTKTQLRRVKRLITAVGLNYKSVQQDQPWVILMHIKQAATKISNRKTHPRYRHFVQLAKKRHLPIRYLDTPKEEIQMMANMPKKLKIDFLMMTVNQTMHIKSLLQNKKALHKAWISGDMKSAAIHFSSMFSDYPGLYQAIVTSRHNRWAKKLEVLLSNPGKPVFVIVGAPHLFGENNLLDYLRKDGYSVTQL